MQQFTRFIHLTCLTLGLSLLVGCSFTHDTTPPEPDAGDKVADDGGKSTTPPPDSSGLCGKVTCAKSATCKGKGAAAKCTCPDGYDDAKGNGTKCDEIDECAEGLDDCNVNASCTNTKGSFECACNGPEYAGDGKSCACAVGYVLMGGKCVVVDVNACTKDGDCDSGHCVSGMCCESACDAPGICQVAKGATCEDGSTCVYAGKPDGTVCDDGEPCTEGDSCQSGECTPAGMTVCNDDNICTDDVCDPGFGCVYDGRTVATTTVCKDDDKCGANFRCEGDVDGTCSATTTLIDCSVLGDTECSEYQCNPDNAGDTAATLCDKTAINEGGTCQDKNPCTTADTCVLGKCTGGPALDCGDGNGCTDDSCDKNTPLGCVNAPNNMSCVDTDPCSTASACSGGTCVGTAFDTCNDSNGCTNDSCTPGVGCQHMSLEGQPCSDGKACTNNSKCSSEVAGNLCVDAVAYSACGTGASACVETGSPRTCTCTTGYVQSGDKASCIANVCSPNPCDATAVCSGTSSFVCSCPMGYVGNGMTGAALKCTFDPCSVDPCGIAAGYATSCTPSGGSNTCACKSGFADVGGKCACDMSGTYAVRFTADIRWSGVAGLKDGSAITRSYMLRRQIHNPATGELLWETVPCGGTTPDVCSIFNKSVGTFVGNEVWGAKGITRALEEKTASMVDDPTSGVPADLMNKMTLTVGSKPGATFKTPEGSYLAGVSLTDPFGKWPANTAGVDGTVGNNGATWQDDDSSEGPGVTANVVKPGGIFAADYPPTPPEKAQYDQANGACGDPYDWAPAYDANNPFDFVGVQVKRLHSASRLVMHLEGTVDATSCGKVTGTVVGPYDAPSCGTAGKPLCGQMQQSGRMHSCVIVNGAAEANCAAGHIKFLDNLLKPDPDQKIWGITFVMEKVDAATTCDEARTRSY